MPSPNIVFGAAALGIYDGSLFDTREKVQEVISLLTSHAVDHIDTSRHYPSIAPGTSEEVLGQANLDGLTIDTKVLSSPGQHESSRLRNSIESSLQALKVHKVNTLYLHFPDDDTPLSDVCKGMNDLYKEGLFENFGISNFTIPQIMDMMQICETNSYVKPTIYQGSYNLLTRNIEQELLPLLRSHGIAYYAYSAAAGGVLNASSTRLAIPGAAGDLYRAQYGSDAMREAVRRLNDAASSHQLTVHAVALRWILHHSALDAAQDDAIIVGARTVGQLKQTLQIYKAGPLPTGLLATIEDVWEMIREDAPAYSMWAKKDGEAESAMDKYLKTLDSRKN